MSKSLQPLGNLAVVVDYDFIKGQEASLSGPYFPDCAVVNGAYINGMLVDADVFKDSVVDKWIDAIMDEHAAREAAMGQAEDGQYREHRWCQLYSKNASLAL